MKKARTTAFLALIMALSMLFCSCSLFVRRKVSQSPSVMDPAQKEESTAPSEDKAEKPVEPTVKELLDGFLDYDFGKVTLMLAAADDCHLPAKDSDSLSVLNTVLSEMEQKYGASVAITHYTPNQMYMGTCDMVQKGSGIHYFTDILLLSATEFARYREEDLLSRLEILPFLDVSSDCFDAELTALFSDESGTYGLVGAGSHAFKAQITLFFNPELLSAAGIDFDGYGILEKGSYDLAALQAVLAAYSEKTKQTALVSGLSEKVTGDLLAKIGAGELAVDSFGNDGYLAFMMGKVPFMIGHLGDVEKIPTARDRCGMLPIPYVEDGAYKTFYDTDCLYVFCVPKGNARTDCTGIFLQAYHTASLYLPYRHFYDQLIEKFVWDEGTLKSVLLVGKKAKPLLIK